MKQKDTKSLRVGMISLGCAKNLVDAEIMLGSLLKEGIEITNDAPNADVLIVNTCSFIDAAQEESVDTILESAELREAKNRGQGLVVSGCLPQRFRDELPKLLPEVDAFMGIDQVAEAGRIIREAAERRRGKLQAPGSNREPKPSGQGSDSRPARESRGTEGLKRTGDSVDPAIRHSSHSSKAAVMERLGELENGKGSAEKSQSEAAAPLVEVNLRPNYIPDYATPRFRLTPRHFAYVKIAEGCNHPCSFCIIPRMRGSHRSRLQGDIAAEARQLIAEGVKELNLISQDSTYYGLDLRSNHSRAISSPDRFNAAVKSLPEEATTICSLLRELNALEGDFWIRLLYTHPAHWTDDLIQTLAECPKAARYVDIPLQHIHENMLERMRRETSREYISDLIKRIRGGVPGIALRTTFIVGFPGETEEYFEALLDFIRETRFERLGVFAYSQEEGTRAGKMAGQVPEKIRQKRRARAMAAQHEIAASVAESFVGRTMKVLIENEATSRELKNARISSWEHGLLRAEENQRSNASSELQDARYLVARGEADAPDIDGRVYVRMGKPKPRAGEFRRVKIIGHTDYDLIGEISDE